MLGFTLACTTISGQTRTMQTPNPGEGGEGEPQNDPAEVLAERLDATRNAARDPDRPKKRGLSYERLAELAGPGGPDKATISAWVRKEAEPRAFALLRVARALKVPVGWLLGEDVVRYLPTGIAIVDQRRLELLRAAAATGDWREIEKRIRWNKATVLFEPEEPRLVLPDETSDVWREIDDLWKKRPGQ